MVGDAELKVLMRAMEEKWPGLSVSERLDMVSHFSGVSPAAVRKWLDRLGHPSARCWNRVVMALGLGGMLAEERSIGPVRKVAMEGIDRMECTADVVRFVSEVLGWARGDYRTNYSRFVRNVLPILLKDRALMVNPGRKRGRYYGSKRVVLASLRRASGDRDLTPERQSLAIAMPSRKEGRKIRPPRH